MTLSLKIPPPLQALICAGLMWLVKAWQPLALHYQVPLGLIVFIIALGLGCALMAMLQFSRANTTVDPRTPDKAQSLQISGIYRFSRNPMYLGLLLLLLAWCLWLGLFVNLMLLALFVSYITTYQIIPEERALTEKFGEDYRRYCQQVRRWL